MKVLDFIFKASSSYLFLHCPGDIDVWFLFKGDRQIVQICPKSTPHVTCLKKKDSVDTLKGQQKYRTDSYIVHEVRLINRPHGGLHLI